MQFTKDITDGINLITGLETHAVRINDQVHQHSLVVSADQLIDPWPPTSVTELSDEHWSVVLDLKPELILLGTGQALIFPEPSQLATVHRAGIGVEVMDTDAACRTFNLLVHEGRSVVAGLIIAPSLAK